MQSLLSRFEGLGHFPTSNFQPTHRRAGGRKYGKGYSFPMLAKKVFPYYLQCRKGLFCQRIAKEKRRNPATLQELYVDENEGTLSPSCHCSLSSMPCGGPADIIFRVRFAHSVKHGIKLTATCGLLLFPFREKELVY